MEDEPRLTGSSPTFRYMLRRLEKAAEYDVPVLLEGETGTGKEMAARSIHYNSPRKDKPFVPVNCGSLPDSLVENELFGHEKGAYTDAKDQSTGLIALAIGGTIFFDEVETLSHRAQAVLLRFLDRREYRPLGGKLVERADVRVIAASNDSLQKLVAEQTFRRDLFYRLNVISFSIPPLRGRGDDVILLAQSFLESLRVQYRQPKKYLHPDVISWMKHYSWPGNVRELENLIHRQFVFAEGDAILPPSAVNSVPTPGNSADEVEMRESFTEVKTRVINQFERHYLQHLMERTHGNVTQAAKVAGKERRALARLLKKHGIDKAQYYSAPSRAGG